MMLLVTWLAVAVFTESQAVLFRDEPRSKLSEFKEELEEYTRNINTAVNIKLILIRSSELGQQLEHYIRDNFVQVKRRWNKLQRELPSEIPEGYNLVAIIPIVVALKTYSAVHELRDKLRPFIEEFYDRLHPILVPWATPVLKMARAHAKTLGARARELDAHLNQKLKSNLEELATWLVPYAQSARIRLHEFQKSLKPFADQVQEWFGEGVEATEGSWQPYVAPVQKALKGCAQVLYNAFIKMQ